MIEVENTHNKINLKKILFPNQNESDINIDVNYMKYVKDDCLFISAFQTEKNIDNPAQNFINVCLFVIFKNNKISKITYFFDTYFPNDEYFFKQRPIFQLTDAVFNK